MANDEERWHLPLDIEMTTDGVLVEDDIDLEKMVRAVPDVEDEARRTDLSNREDPLRSVDADELRSLYVWGARRRSHRDSHAVTWTM